MFETRNCRLCGKEFIPQSNAQHFCNEKCRNENKNNRIREKEKEKRQTMHKSRVKRLTLQELAMQSKLAGVSYGQYVAQIEMQKGAKNE